MADTHYFDKVVGGVTVYLDPELMAGVKFCIMLHGEDVSKVLECFWKERDDSGMFCVVPITAYGLPPRPELCSKQSLREALKTAFIQPNSSDERRWKLACEAHKVPFGGRPGAPGWKHQERSTEPVP
jgi:hypothetical protein